MKTGQVLVGVVFILGCATGAAVRELAVPARAQGQAPIVYQYDTLNIQDLGLMGGSKEERDAALNRYGREGWRVAASVAAIVIFERAIQLQPRPLPAASSMQPPGSALAPAPVPAKP